MAGDKHVLSLNICTAVAPRDFEQKGASFCQAQRLTESVTQRAESPGQPGYEKRLRRVCITCTTLETNLPPIYTYTYPLRLLLQAIIDLETEIGRIYSAPTSHHAEKP